MPIKKSAILFILLTVSSVGLLVFSSSFTPDEPVMPAKCNSVKCCKQMNEPKILSPFYMISQIMLRSAA